MKINLTEEAVKDRKELSEEELHQMKKKLKEVTEKLSHKDLKLISNPLLNHPIWQFIIDEGKTNHRAYLDVRNGKTVVIAVWDFEFTHQGDHHWNELKGRL